MILHASVVRLLEILYFLFLPLLHYLLVYSQLDNSSRLGASVFAFSDCSFARSSASSLCKIIRRQEYINPKLVPGYFAVGLYVRNASSINRLTAAFECVPFFVRVPISLPIMPCSVAHLPPNGAYSMPNCSRCLCFRYSVKVVVFQSSMSRACQSVAGGSLCVALFILLISFPPSPVRLLPQFHRVFLRPSSITLHYHLIPLSILNFLRCVRSRSQYTVYRTRTCL